MALIFQKAAERLASLPQIQHLVIPFQKIRKPLGALRPISLVPIQSGIIHGNVLHLTVQGPDVLQSLLHLVHIAQTQHRKRNLPSLIFHVDKLLEHGVDGMIVVGDKKHCPAVKERRGYGIDYGVGLARAGRPLNVCHRIPHGIVDGQKLVQIDLSVHQHDGITLDPSGTVQQVSEKRLYGHRHPILLVHFEDSLILRMQIQRNIHAQPDYVGHVVNPADSRGMFHHPVLDDLLISLKVLQKLIIIRVQKFADILPHLPAAVFRTDCDLLRRPQDPALHVQLQHTAGQHIKPLVRMDAQHIHGQPLNGQSAVPAPLFVHPKLKILHHCLELLVVQHIALSLKALPVQIAHQRKVPTVGNRVHAAAHLQIVQYFQVCSVVKYLSVSMGIQSDILHQSLVDGAERPLHDLGGKNRINIDVIVCLCRIFPQMKAVHSQSTPNRIQAPDADPVLGDLPSPIFILDLQPFPFVYGPENIVAYAHFPSPCMSLYFHLPKRLLQRYTRNTAEPQIRPAYIQIPAGETCAPARRNPPALCCAICPASHLPSIKP